MSFLKTNLHSYYVLNIISKSISSNTLNTQLLRKILDQYELLKYLLLIFLKIKFKVAFLCKKIVVTHIFIYC